MGRKVAKHVARNKKKYWRKISTKDVEDQLEDVRIQEMTGGRRSEQPDHLLYHIDTERPLGSSDAMETSVQPKRKERPPLDLNNLNTYKILQPHSAVPPAGVDTRDKKDPKSKSTKRLAENQELAETRRAKKKKYQRASEQRVEAEQKNTMAKLDRLATDDPTVAPTYDLWNAEDEKKKKVRQLIGTQLAAYTDQIYQTYDWKVPNHIVKKPSKLPAVEAPLPGTSYNPTYDDHQELLRKALDVELEKQRQEQKLQRSLPSMLAQTETGPLKREYMKEMAAGLFDDENEPEETSTMTSLSVGKPVKVEPKTSQQRSRENLRKKQEAKVKAEKEKRMRDNQVFRLKSIRKEIKVDETKDQERRTKRHEKYEQRENFGTKKFGRYKFEEADLDLNLSDEITGNLRTMKAEGNILHDRFKSFQKRNIIETRVRAKPTKTKMKKYEKRSVREVGVNYRPK